MKRLARSASEAAEAANQGRAGVGPRDLTWTMTNGFRQEVQRVCPSLDSGKFVSHEESRPRIEAFPQAVMTVFPLVSRSRRRPFAGYVSSISASRNP